MRVPADFDANCRRRRRVVTCRVSQIPDEFADLMFGLRGGTLAGVEVRRLPGIAAEIRFSLKRTALRLQETILEKPRRWVVELGTPDVLMGPVAENLPFRPYPMKTGRLGFIIPPARIQPLPPRSEAAQQYQDCYKSWKEELYDEAIAFCEAVDIEALDAAPGQMAQRIIAEATLSTMEPGSTEDLPAVSAALAAAERATREPIEKVRYPLLEAQVLEELNYLNRAELLLENRMNTYVDTAAEPYLLAAQARMLMQVGAQEKARRVLQQLRRLPGDAPTIGRAITALAGLAYEEGAWVMATGLFDLARERWPDVLEAQASSLFQSAEVYLMFDRVDDAERAYRGFLDGFPNLAPHWVAEVRLNEILSYSDPDAALENLRNQAADLKVKEGQDLAFLRYSQLLDNANARQRTIRALSEGKVTEYVLEELTIRSMELALSSGRLDEAFAVARGYWDDDEGRLLSLSPQIFDRVLYLVARDRAKADEPFDLLRMYYGNRERFEKHTLRGEVHLMVGQGLRRLAMFSEALRVMQSGLGGTTAEREPNAAARLYKEIAAVLWQARDRFRLEQILDYLDARFPRRFDDYDYWMARGHRAWWDGRLQEARDIFVYALNGPMKGEHRLELMDVIIDLYSQMEDWPRARRACQARIELHDRIGRPRSAIGRRDARWRTAEIDIETEQWGPALAALTTFLDEYPDDPERLEARFLMGRALYKLGDIATARMQWELVAKEEPDGTFGKLAMMELELLRWRQKTLGNATNRAGL